MFKNTQKGNVYLLLTIVVVAFLTVGTVVYLQFPEEKAKIQIIIPPKDQFKQREIQLSEVLQSLTSGGSKEISESDTKKVLEGLSGKIQATPQKKSEIQNDVLESLIK